jgi:hypothetical protein
MKKHLDELMAISFAVVFVAVSTYAAILLIQFF